GDPVEGFEAVVLRCLAVRVQIDEPGSHHQTFHVDDRCALQRGGGDHGNLGPAYADIANRVESRFWIDHPAIGQNDVTLLGNQPSREQHRRQPARAPPHYGLASEAEEADRRRMPRPGSTPGATAPFFTTRTPFTRTYSIPSEYWAAFSKVARS